MALEPASGLERIESSPPNYEGKEIIMLDRVPVRLVDRLLVTIESTRPEWPHGIGTSEGLEVFGERVKRAVIWQYFSVPPEQRSTTP